jgi:hypothetical protein
MHCGLKTRQRGNLLKVFVMAVANKVTSLRIVVQLGPMMAMVAVKEVEVIVVVEVDVVVEVVVVETLGTLPATTVSALDIIHVIVGVLVLSNHQPLILTPACSLVVWCPRVMMMQSKMQEAMLQVKFVQQLP